MLLSCCLGQKNFLRSDRDFGDNQIGIMVCHIVRFLTQLVVILVVDDNLGLSVGERFGLRGLFYRYPEIVFGR